ncbi:hypothetical protein P3T35_003027 [Kitasatospora sp. GP30]|uniref:hypothetical protein n=1 Tax=Kitasatospora sp. GP30 TaxID=3035084 RepID=UPI000C7135E3|nr:hypothetical protein [Kitasatospora sp. GP30]MDH6141014.1 hypothetical protein [Kitasatospora sp. GP30]
MTAENKPVLQALFDIKVKPRIPEPQPDPEPETRNATARWVTTRIPNRKGGWNALLVVDCPFCQNLHVHPGGTTMHPQLGTRQARCIGTATKGLEYRIRLTQQHAGGDQ